MGSSRRLVAAAAVLLAVIVTAPAQAASPRTLARFISVSGLGGSVSVSVVRLDGSSVYEFQGTRHDCGSKLGYLQANVLYALRHPEIGNDFSAFLDSLPLRSKKPRSTAG